MLTQKDIQQIIEREFENLNWNIEPRGLYEPIGYILSLGGKRIRPALVLMAANLFSEEVSQAVPAALGLEIFHNFTLLHDDIMDKAPIRRGKPTVHIKWNENTAILSGDAMLIEAYKHIASIKADKLKACLDIFSKTAVEVCEGQQYDMEFETRSHVSADEYIEMIRLKTSVLLAACLQIGAIIGGATDEQARRLYDFGINLGLGFQLKDDWLDVYGDEKTFGKQIGGDILENKKTFLLITALQKASTEQKSELDKWIADENPNPQEKIRAVTDIYNQTEAKSVCEEKMQEYFDKAVVCLENIDVPTERKENLFLLIKNLINRNL